MVDKTREPTTYRTPFLNHLLDLPFVKEARVEELDKAPPGEVRADGLLLIQAPRRTYRFLFEHKRTHIGYPIADGVIAAAKKDARYPWILFAPRIGKPMGEYLAAECINYVDEAGNCRLALGQEHFAVIEGRRPRTDGADARTTGPVGFEVMFALLAKEELLGAPVREIAEEIGAGKTAVANAIRQLVRQGLVTANKPRRILRKKELLDRWLAGYETQVRPRRLIGRYRTKEIDPEQLEMKIEELLADEHDWAWGGGTAAMKLTRFYRGPETVLVIRRLPPEFLRDVRALPAEDGNLTVLRAAGRLAFDGPQPHTVHPLLVFTELRTAGHERAREAAEEIRDRYLDLER